MSVVPKLAARALVLHIIAGISLFSAPPSAQGTWEMEIVDTSGPAQYSSLKIDTAGNAHIAYVIDDGQRYPLKYAFRDRALNRWFVMTVAERASFCSIALDSRQRPHISYADQGMGSGAKLRYAHWNGNVWQRQPIPLNSNIIGYYTSIVLDSKDQPTISFYEYRGPRGSDISVRMRTVTWTGQEWQLRTIDGQNQSGKFNSLAIDSLDHIHLAYANVNAITAGIRYAYWDGSSWKRERIDGREESSGDLVGYAACLAVDAQGRPHVTYMNYTNPALKYAVRKEGKWSVMTVDRLARVAYPDRNSIAISDKSEPYIGYYDAGLGVLKLAHMDSRGWSTETVDGSGSGFTSALQLHEGTIWISYNDTANNALKVARRPM